MLSFESICSLAPYLTGQWEDDMRYQGSVLNQYFEDNFIRC